VSELDNPSDPPFQDFVLRYWDRNELFTNKIFYSLKEVIIINKKWRNHYNTIRHAAHWVIDH